MKKFASAGVLAAVSTLVATAASASPCGVGPVACTAVPEINAYAGVAAVAALLAVVALVWERRRAAI